jgi:methylase of polypeptide subunit release factors
MVGKLVVANPPYISHHSEDDIKEMLREIGVGDVLDLYRDIPEKYILKSPQT